MKKTLFTILISATLFTSCVSTKVSEKNNFDYSLLKADKNYIIETQDGNKIRAFKYSNQNNQTLFGSQEGKEIQVEKDKVKKILKTSTGKTLGLVIGIIGAAVFIPSYVNNAPVGQSR